MSVPLSQNSWVQNSCGKLLYKRKTSGCGTTPAIASSLENQPGLPMGVAAVLRNTFCNWEIVEIVGKGTARWQGAITKALLTHAATSVRQESWDHHACSWHAAKSWRFPMPPFSFFFSFSSHSKHKVDSKTTNHQDNLGSASCLPLRPLLLSESKETEMEASHHQISQLLASGARNSS